MPLRHQFIKSLITSDGWVTVLIGILISIDCRANVADGQFSFLITGQCQCQLAVFRIDCVYALQPAYAERPETPYAITWRLVARALSATAHRHVTVSTTDDDDDDKCCLHHSPPHVSQFPVHHSRWLLLIAAVISSNFERVGRLVSPNTRR